MNPIARYLHWLHTRWPAGRVEPLPEAGEGGELSMPGVYVVGDLLGVPLLKFAADSGARAVRRVAADPALAALRRATADSGARDLVILGAGVSGMAAALEARALGLDFELIEGAAPLGTIANFPVGKPIFAYPPEMNPAGALRIAGATREALLAELTDQTLGRGIAPRAGSARALRRRGGLIEVELAPPTRTDTSDADLSGCAAANVSNNADVSPADAPRTVLARRVIVALGRGGAFRRLGVPGEELPKVSNRLHDPKDFAGRRALVVGGGDAAVETAIALAECGARVAIAHRGAEFARPKPENLEKLKAMAFNPAARPEVEAPEDPGVEPAVGDFMREQERDGSLAILTRATVREIRPDAVVLNRDGRAEPVVLGNDNVFVMIGREAPLGFFRRSGIRVAGEWTARRAAGFGLFLAFCLALYNLKSGGELSRVFESRGWFPFGLRAALARWTSDPRSLAAVLATSASSPSFYYTLAYTLLVAWFGAKRIRRRRTPYVMAQTLTLIFVQTLPLFILPEIVLPWLGRNGLLPGGLADALFPAVSYGHGREYWRAYGLILAWPLFIYNVFTAQPLWTWLGISLVQTFVVIPGIVYVWGKGAYCGWICSCGALAETLGDAHRHKMPHGPGWNRLNYAGQAILALALGLFALRVWGWAAPGSWAAGAFDALLDGKRGGRFVNPLNYKWVVDVGLAGVLGVGTYFWFSGRVWCRFFCPLAALMHIYARFGRFGILGEKKKCISCNVCTSVCHQGIDVMNFANKGLAMTDPQCVRCSACVGACPTGTLAFGRVDKSGAETARDRLSARRD